MAQEISHLARGEGLDAAVQLLHAVDEVGRKRMPQCMEILPMVPCRFQDPLVPLPEVDVSRIIPALVAYKGCTRPKVVLPVQILYSYY